VVVLAHAVTHLMHLSKSSLVAKEDWGGGGRSRWGGGCCACWGCKWWGLGVGGCKWWGLGVGGCGWCMDGPYDFMACMALLKPCTWTPHLVVKV
jgi:hypothetical protein